MDVIYIVVLCTVYVYQSCTIGKVQNLLLFIFGLVFYIYTKFSFFPFFFFFFCISVERMNVGKKKKERMRRITDLSTTSPPFFSFFILGIEEESTGPAHQFNFPRFDFITYIRSSYVCRLFERYHSFILPEF